MTLIQRQDALVAKLLPIHLKRINECGGRVYGDIAGARSKTKRLHIEELIAAGYSKREAADSASQCDDMACLYAACETGGAS